MLGLQPCRHAIMTGIRCQSFFYIYFYSMLQ